MTSVQINTKNISDNSSFAFFRSDDIVIEFRNLCLSKHHDQSGDYTYHHQSCGEVAHEDVNSPKEWFLALHVCPSDSHGDYHEKDKRNTCTDHSMKTPKMRCAKGSNHINSDPKTCNNCY